jgi:hypothetical protein
MSEETCSQKTNIMNNRIYERNIPSSPLQPYLSARPVLSKYSTLPIIDQRRTSGVPMIQRSTFHSEQTFNPGTSTAPWSGFATNVNLESELRNQIYALQKNSHSVYVPSSRSDLYKVHWQGDKNKVQQPHPDLFLKPQLQPFNPNPKSTQIGYALFHNATRQQLKDCK